MVSRTIDNLDQTSTILEGLKHFKITSSMEEILLTLLFLCIIENKWSVTGFVQALVKITGRTPKTIGVTLQKLDNMKIIEYGRDGQNRRITINFTNEFVQTLLVTLFGFTEQNTNDDIDEHPPFKRGFFPANVNFSAAIEQINRLIKNTDEEIQEIRGYLQWISEQEQWVKKVKDVDFDDPIELEQNPLYQFAEEIIFGFRREEKNHVNGLTVSLQKEIIHKKLESERLQIPWLLNAMVNRGLNIEEF
ncbi:hypothetical protein DRO91_08035 [Candidatus Heimdallarchaeota archaeon]|nr:MAG: hypothetical protein DRO63_07900 [Candidatus Gerdarchaeota archaeon]RLI69189.1 MAG: hypothetical protein DRO91_08035 [Candidatus Heimdallarchaeota archaeon]RLI70386.1 MAG: hypothetical protein DRP02_07955 [Candidatus Gerdarchaeota archaeon]